MYEAVIFDIDRTIVNLSNRFLEKITKRYQELFRKMSKYPIPDDFNFLEPMRLPYPDSKHLLNGLEIEPEELWSNLKMIDFPAREKDIGKEITVYEDARELLKNLDGTKIGGVSNTPHSIVKMQIEELGLERHFSDNNLVCYTYNEPNSKPSPHGPKMLLERLSVDPDNTILIGDDKIDIESGHSIGTYTGLIIRDGKHYAGKVNPDVKSDSLLELWRLANEMQMR